MTAFVFKCPNTCRHVQHWLDDDEDVPDNEYEVIKCTACAKLHSSIEKPATSWEPK